MRFCVSGRQPYSVLKQADEIKVAYADKDRILDFVEQIPNKTIILDVPGDQEEWDLWKMYSEKFQEFYIALHDLSRVNEFNQNGIKWYWPYPITTYYELEMIVDSHPSYIMIGPPLSFDLNGIISHLYDPCDLEKTKTIPLRMIVNVAHPAYLPINGNHGICGQWIRPEDVNLYSTKIRCFEFDECATLKEEETLLSIYRKQEWPGNLNLLIKRLDFNVDNRAIPEEFGERRMSCGQRCWTGSRCHFCINALNFADQIRKERLYRNQQAKIDNN